MAGSTHSLAVGAAAMLLSLQGCIASNVVAESDRAVKTPVAELEWQPATAADLTGLYESVAIRGEAADSLWKIYYLFEANGRYTAAALVSGEQGLHFQVIDGTWALTTDGLVLDGADPAPIAAAGEHLRLSPAKGTVILRRSRLE